ncbi:MAG TPA: muconolactone Delta-isomerase family protein [Ktedonobacteraceae bacterium]|nr:muconolactone Delta-isomerase family protein [Ktedonobacteraceae bacterium]
MKYMVLVTFDHRDEDAFNATIPAEQAHVQKLLDESVIEGIYVALDGSRGWTVLRGETREQIEQILPTFPLFPYMSTELIQLFE